MAVNNHRCFGFASGFGSKPKYSQPSSGLHLLNYQLSKSFIYLFIFIFFCSCKGISRRLLLIHGAFINPVGLSLWKPQLPSAVDRQAGWYLRSVGSRRWRRQVAAYIPLWLSACVCVCPNVHWDWCKCAVLIPVTVYVGVSVPALAFDCVFRRWYNILFCEKRKALN